MTSAFAIAAMGVSRQGRKLGISDLELRREAVELALAEAGVERDAVDGYIHSWRTAEDLRYLGLSPKVAWQVFGGGQGATASIQTAMGLIATGQAELVACVYGLAPSSGYIPGADPSVRSVGAAAYGHPERYDMVGAAATHALHAQWHMARHGTTSRHLGAVAVALRNHALKRPVAWGYGRPITLEDHQASRMIVDPFRQLDCCMDTDGGVALLVTSAERARSLPTQPVYIRGMGFGHNVRNWHRGDVYGHHDDIAPAAAKAFAQARVGLQDIDVAQLYDPFTISVIMQLEEYGFCGPGQGGPFVADGAIASDGAIPTNTCGGQLSGFYATGYTPVVEAVWQLRGEGGNGQVAGAELALVSNHGLNGGVQNTWSHCTMILGCEP